MSDTYPLPRVDKAIIDEVRRDAATPDFFAAEDAELLEENPQVYRYLSELAAEIAPDDLSKRAQIFRAGQALIEVFERQAEVHTIEELFAMATKPHPADEAA